ncbi:P-loop containing nucleoside triphosphate hydrolase protein [Lophium mytilinum]|uniref:P-loop containing nucleoside triphosphate hydrolase protein n=1 Tax=Lophium mytilinum TaxID=390894 RepID=A0A6A6QCY7_9PEZI|nr:P-loop containing nucleoside triphosphate hydrolase protein [Lophium mytilinum]
MIPGFLAMRVVAMRYFKHDITPWVIKALFAGGIYTMGKHLWQTMGPFAEKHLLTSVSVTNLDPLYDHVSKWVSTNVGTKSTKHFSARTYNGRGENSRNGEEDVDSDESENITTPEKTTRSQVHFLPVKGGRQYFWHRGCLFRFKNEVTGMSAQSAHLNEETLTVSCFGRNPEHLRLFLDECVQFSGPDTSKTTRIHFLQKTPRTFNGEMSWCKTIVRPARSLATVDLNEKAKESVVAEIADYLSDRSPPYYAQRGIPHRRGYLLYGPPGTGKTSFANALAANFKLDMYVIQILGTMMDDETLMSAFEQLPKRCIVLLEDIDSAGIQREDMKDNKTTKRKNTFLTLSGVLNAIDGASSPEGRLLIMTSNTPESLDAALIRPGRIDRQVYFGHVDRKVASSIFIRMFAKSAEDLHRAQDGPLILIDNDGENVKLRQAARLFAESIPEDEITPAELQNFLLQHKNMTDAVANVGAWALAICEAKKAGANIVEDPLDAAPAKRNRHAVDDDEADSDSDSLFP